MKPLNDLKDDTLRGNVLDSAAGIVIGAASSAVVTWAVGNMLMPVSGTLTGGIGFKGLPLTAGDTQLRYGVFIQAAITFLVIAFLFLFGG